MTVTFSQSGGADTPKRPPVGLRADTPCSAHRPVSGVVPGISRKASFLDGVFSLGAEKTCAPVGPYHTRGWLTADLNY